MWMPEVLVPLVRPRLLDGNETGGAVVPWVGLVRYGQTPIPDHLPRVETANRPTTESGLFCSPWSYH